MAHDLFLMAKMPVECQGFFFLSFALTVRAHFSYKLWLNSNLIKLRAEGNFRVYAFSK